MLWILTFCLFTMQNQKWPVLAGSRVNRDAGKNGEGKRNRESICSVPPSSEMPTRIKIDDGDYGIKNGSKSSRITSAGSPLWRKGTWNVIARPWNLCAASDLRSQFVNPALALTLSLRIFGSKLWLHVSCKTEGEEIREGEGKKRREREAENGVTTDNWTRTAVYSACKRPPFFLGKFSKH